MNHDNYVIDRPQSSLASELVTMTFNHFITCLEILFDRVVVMLKGVLVAVWFPGEVGIGIRFWNRDCPKFGSVGGIDAKFEGIAGGEGGGVTTTMDMMVGEHHFM